MISVKIDKLLVGDDPAKFLANMTPVLGNRLPEAIGYRLMKEIKSNILTNKYGFVLSSSWLAKKRTKSWDSRPFIAEGHLLNNIVLKRSGNQVTVGFRENAKHPRSRLTYAQIAFLLEYGSTSDNLEPRPLWRYTIDDYISKLDIVAREELQIIINQMFPK